MILITELCTLYHSLLHELHFLPIHSRITSKL